SSAPARPLACKIGKLPRISAGALGDARAPFDDVKTPSRPFVSPPRLTKWPSRRRKIVLGPRASAESRLLIVSLVARPLTCCESATWSAQNQPIQSAEWRRVAAQARYVALALPILLTSRLPRAPPTRRKGRRGRGRRREGGGGEGERTVL
ncbi:uncharacterized protein SCHCODRAFT_02567877, partial [Schizophyllum commune H4-8]|uniref:uncharacterized protein n=1 Tax=Schizophyllum commune (strain H4-8 / FGSC 9210) TaxID=578458 RepID=UPI00215E93A1